MYSFIDVWCQNEFHACSFGNVFDVFTSDSDENCKNGSELLDRLLKVRKWVKVVPFIIDTIYHFLGYCDWIATNFWPGCFHSIVAWTNLHKKFVFKAIHHLLDICVECSAWNQYDHISTGNSRRSLPNAGRPMRRNSYNVSANGFYNLFTFQWIDH